MRFAARIFRCKCQERSCLHQTHERHKFSSFLSFLVSQKLFCTSKSMRRESRVATRSCRSSSEHRTLHHHQDSYHFKPQQMPNVTTQSIHIKNSSRFVSKDIGCCCGVSRTLFTHWRSLVSHTSDTQTKGSSCLVDSWYIDANICFLHASCNDRLSLSLQALAPFCESAWTGRVHLKLCCCKPMEKSLE